MARPSYAYLQNSFRARAVEGGADGDHWQGGPAYHEGTECPLCKRPLLLIWDINCLDPRFGEEPRSVFDGLQRLPLYYCWTCSGSIAYQVNEGRAITIIEHRGDRQPPDFPYANYPLKFRRRGLELTTEGPQQLEAILRRWEEALDKDGDITGECLRAGEREALADWFGHDVTIYGVDFVHHQLGGLPLRLAQGDMDQIECPNAQCRKRHPFRPARLKFLAVVLNDPPGGLPMIEPLNAKTKKFWNSTVQVVFHICKHCLTIHATNVCD